MTLRCDLCGQETHEDYSELFDVYYGDGMTQERHCFDCNPPDDSMFFDGDRAVEAHW